MATIQKRKNKNGKVSYRVQIRQSDGFPPTSKTFPTRQEAKDWATLEEARRRQGIYSYPRQTKHTLADLIDRYLLIVLPTKPKNAQNVRHHLSWWKEQIGSYAVARLSPDLIATCRH